MDDEHIPSICLTFKYRLLATKRQHAVLADILEQQRELFNCALQERMEAWRMHRKSISLYDQHQSLTVIRREMPEFKRFPVNLQRGTLVRLDEAFRGFFARVKRGEKAGLPRFRGKGRFSSFSFACCDGMRFDGKRIRFKGMPSGLRVHLHRPLPDGKIVTAEFKRDIKGWYVYLSVRVRCQPARPSLRRVGVDVGLSALATLSTGEKIPNPKPAKKARQELRRRQRALSRCRCGSKRRTKVRTKVLSLHRKVANIRRTHLHQLSARLVREYDLIAVEKMQMKGLLRSMFSGQIQDAGWAGLRDMIRYKAACAGAMVIEVPPKHTSQDCSRCGTRVPKALSVTDPQVSNAIN